MLRRKEQILKNDKMFYSIRKNEEQDIKIRSLQRRVRMLDAGTEVKRFGTAYSAQTNRTSVISTFATVSQGDNQDERIGTAISVKSIEFTGSLVPGAQQNIVRLIVFQDNGYDGTNALTQSEITQAFSSSGGVYAQHTSGLNQNNFPVANKKNKRCRLLFDKIYTVPSAATHNEPIRVHFKRNYKRPIRVNFETTGAGGSDLKGQLLYCLIPGQSITAADNPSIDFRTYINYVD